MSKKANSSIYHFYIQNYIQTQKLKCFLNIGFNNYELTPRAERSNTLYAIETKLGIRIYCHARIFTVFTQRR